MTAKTVRSVSMQELAPAIVQAIQTGGSAELTVTGRSMTPFLRDRVSRVRLTAISQPKRGDVVLYRRQNGGYVLHRIAACCVRRDFFSLIKGKNRHADHFVLHERLADTLTLAVVNQIGKPQRCLFFDVLIYILSSFSDSLLRILPNIKVLLRIFLPDAPGRAKQKGCPCAGMPRRPLLSNSMWQSGIKKTPSKRMESF